jgi:hypothetical protein
MFLNKKKSKKTLKAFSLPEVLLSMFVLTIGLVVIVAIMAGSLGHSYKTRDAIIAMGLAQEGVELVRNVRDSDFAAGNNGFTRFSDTNRYCRANWNSSQTGNIDCFNNPNPANRYYLQYRGSMYVHFNATKERYSRFIYIDYDPGSGAKGHTALVRSFVYWDEADIRPSDGDPAVCNASDKCVYTEIFLTAWH